MSNNSLSSTAAKLLSAAEILFAAKGFYGTSIRDVAERLSIAKSSVLHHFPRKEKLYATVLQKLADEMTREVIHIKDRFEGEPEQLKRFVEILCTNSKTRFNRDSIILRELLDNPERAPKVKKWFFGPYLNELIGIVTAGQKNGLFKPINPAMFILHMLGAHHYFIIALPTVKYFLDNNLYEQMIADHQAGLEALIEDRLMKRS